MVSIAMECSLPSADYFNLLNTATFWSLNGIEIKLFIGKGTMPRVCRHTWNAARQIRTYLKGVIDVICRLR